MHRNHAPLLIPNAWDAMSARTFKSIGFKAIATTSGGVAWSLGYQDGEKAPWDEVVAATRRIARAVAVPVTADIEAGYAENCDEVRDHVAEIIAAGAVGLNLEDQKGGELREISDAAARISAAREAARSIRVPIVINARTDVYHVKDEPDGGRFAETIHRAKAYQAAGADCIFVFGVSDVQAIAGLVAAIDLPVNIVGRAGLPKLSELAKIGVGRITIASSMALYSFGCVHNAAARLFETGEFELPKGSMTRATAQALFSQDR